MRTRCPCCGATSSLDVLVTHEDARAALVAAFARSGALGRALLRYLALHRPATRELTHARMNTLMAELDPYLERGLIPRKGRDWPVEPADWVQAIEQMLAARDAGKLSTPLNGHGYLLETLAGIADKSERVAEQGLEAQRRQAGSERMDCVTVRGQPMAMGDALQTVFGGRDPALVQLESKTPVPLPPAPPAPARPAGISPLVRQMKAQLRKNP